MFVNTTLSARVTFRSLLRDKLRQLNLSDVRFFNDQFHLNRALMEVRHDLNEDQAMRFATLSRSLCNITLTCNTPIAGGSDLQSD